MELPVKAVSVYLTRKCPRNCAYCNISNKDKDELNVEQWKDAFRNLRRLGVEFFLILGNEPLLLGDDLLELIRFWKEEKYYYALYSTSPLTLFKKWAKPMLAAGLQNWSSGLDYIYEAYFKANGEGLISDETHRMVMKNPNLIVKANDSLYGLKFMKNKVPTHALITISRFNYEYVPEMLEWIRMNHPTIHVGVNTVEYQTCTEMDFAPPKSACQNFFFEDRHKEGLDKMYERFLEKRKEHLFYSQVPNSYLKNMSKFAVDLDWSCYGFHIPSVDSDGTFRTCGYMVGKRCAKHNVLDFDRLEFLQDWDADVFSCPGCYWSYPWFAKASQDNDMKPTGLFEIEKLKGKIFK